MAKCRCILHEFPITTSTSTTKMMMIITVVTMLINKRKLCQPQNVCTVYVFAYVFVCAVHFLTVYFWFFFIYNLFHSHSLVDGWVSGCKSFLLISSFQFQPNYIVAMCMFSFFAFCITRIFYDPDLPSYMQNSHVYVARQYMHQLN